MHLLCHCFDNLMQRRNNYFHLELHEFLAEILYWWQESGTIPSVFSSTSQWLLMGKVRTPWHSCVLMLHPFTTRFSQLPGHSVHSGTLLTSHYNNTTIVLQFKSKLRFFWPGSVWWLPNQIKICTLSTEAFMPLKRIWTRQWWVQKCSIVSACEHHLLYLCNKSSRHKFLWVYLLIYFSLQSKD